jgi:hypothetical protein
MTANEKYDRMGEVAFDPSYQEDYISQVELRRKEYCNRVEIDKQMIDNLKRRGEFEIIDDMYDHARETMACEMKVAIYGKDHPKKHIVRYPADWWEALKERFAPSWFLDKCPVKFTEITASLEELYPDLDIALPDKSPVLKFRVLKNPDYPIW